MNQTPVTSSTMTQKPNSGLAIASLACGITSIVLMGIFTAIPAVICGHMAMGRLKREPDTYNSSSRGMAIAGYITIALTILIVVAIIIAILAAAAQQGR